MAVIRWSSALTRNEAAAEEEGFAALRAHFSERDIVELTLFTCLFNAWNRLQDGFHNELEAPGARVQWQEWNRAGQAVR